MIADMASTEFTIYQDRVYYLDTNGDVLSRNLHNTNDVTVEMESTDFTLNSTAGEYTLSEDGLYWADVSSPGVVRVINMQTKEYQNFTLDNGINPTDLSMSADGKELLFRDSADNSLHRMELTLGDSPQIVRSEKIMSATSSGFRGLSLDGGSHRTNFRIHSGPDAGQQLLVTAGDVRLHTLGLSRTRVDSHTNAQEALSLIMEAIDTVSIQRAKLGAQQSRLTHTFESLREYQDNIAQSDSIIRDVDMARESAEMANWQVKHQAATSILLQANQFSSASIQSLLR